MTGRLGRVAFKLAHVLEPRGAILVYHRVGDPGCDPFSLAVAPRRFADQISALRAHYSIVPLRDLAAAAAAGSVPHRAVAVTFDDGYADNLYEAKPVLAAAGAPATVFVVAGKVGAGEEFWWDRLARWVLHAPKVPADLSLDIDGSRQRFDASAAERSPAVDAGDGSWSMRAARDVSPRHSLFRELWGILRPLKEDVRARAMSELGARFDDTIEADRQIRPLREDELATLGADGFIEIASHGMTHSRFADLSEEAQRAELCESRARLERLLGRPVTSFAYPFGTADDYTPDTVRLVEAAGYAAGCMNVSGWVVAGVGPYELPRLRVFDWGADELIRRLRRLLWA